MYKEHKYIGTWVHGNMGTWVYGSTHVQYLWVHSYGSMGMAMGAWEHGNMGAWIKVYKHALVLNCLLNHFHIFMHVNTCVGLA